jgi:phosphatidate cytidylyltransferase
MLSQRVKAALVFIPLVLILIYFGGWLFNLFILMVLVAAAYEYTRLFFRIDNLPSFPTIMVGIFLVVMHEWVFKGEYPEILITLLIILTAVVALVAYERNGRDMTIGFALNLAGIIYIGWVGSAFIPFRALESGRGWVLTALPAVWLADSGAYFIGSWLGGPKMSPRLSPGKTWAGLAGGTITGTLFGALLVLLWRSVSWLPPETPLWQGLVMGFVLSLVSAMGDLLVSLFKRTAGVKDTGDLIPGHGGILDRIDSWIWAALIGYYLVLVYNYI